MRKTIEDLAVYLKKIIVPEPNEPLSLNQGFEHISDEETIKEGIFAFRFFLHQLCDVMIEKGSAYDNKKKASHAYENRTTLSVYYPFFHNLKTLLMNIGLQGQLEEKSQCLICKNSIFNEKLSYGKNMECFRFLTDCGMVFDGLDFDIKKLDLEQIGTIKISCPHNLAMLMGLKIMAMAEKELGTLVNQDIFLRCDYRVLKVSETNEFSILKDTINTLPSNIQEFILGLHSRCLDKGFKCTVEIKGLWIYIKYSYKRKELWGVNASLNNGFHINVKGQNMDKYMDTVETFPVFLNEIITKGYGCGRKIAHIGHCNGGCRGMIIPLDDAVLELKGYIETWLDLEQFYLAKK